MTELQHPEQPTAQTDEPTGHPAVDEVLQRLDVLDTLPVAEHVAVFEEVLTGLRSSLAAAGGPTDSSA